MEIKETVVEDVTEVKEEQEYDVSLIGIATVAVLGAVKPLAGGFVWGIGLGAGLLFGKQAALKTMGTYIIVNSVHNVARYMTGEFNKKK